VVLQIGAVGICGTDLGLLAMGGVGGRPIPLGHELSGTVVEAGAEVSSVKVGDRVVLNPLPNMIGNGGPEGGFADRLLVRDVAGKPHSLLPLPSDLSFDMGAIVEPIAVGTHAANRLGAGPGDKVAIFGAGAIGLATLAVLRYRGVEDIVVFDLSAFRRARAQAMGARAVADPSQQPAQAVLIEQHGGAEVYRVLLPQTTHFVEATGAPILPEIVACAGLGATICVVALHKKPEAMEFRHVMAKELTIVGAMGYPNEFEEAIALVRSGRIDLEPMISHRFEGPRVLEAFETAKRADESAKVLVRFNEEPAAS
jgi:threonine dehydrogenase-like Zn-dependent dehydrogenase